MVGLPTYDELTMWHRPEVEGLEGGLIGQLRGITTSPDPTAASIRNLFAESCKSFDGPLEEVL